MAKTDGPMPRHIHRENAERMLVASFISGLAGKVGKHIRYQSPRKLEQSLIIALAFQEAEKQEKVNENIYTRLKTRSD
jgi:hypothetical protein